MPTRIISLLLTLLLSAGCSALRHQADEFGTSIFARALSFCDGEMWTSNEADEKLCVRRSLERPDTFLITQDALEYWWDGLMNFTSNSVTSGSGLYEAFINDDTEAKWRKAARQYTRKHYGGRASLARFKRLGGATYIFEVEPGDQIPDWEQAKIPRYVLASQMPGAHLHYSPLRGYATSVPNRQRTGPAANAQGASARLGSPPQTGPGGSALSLSKMLDKAVRSSLLPGQTPRFVAVEQLDPQAYRRYVALAAARRPPVKSLAGCEAQGIAVC